LPSSTLKLDLCDVALLAALAVAAVLGTLTTSLLVNDAAVFLSAGWFGNSWDLYFGQNADRVVSTFITYGPAWAARWAFGLSSTAYIVLAHVFYFAVPFVLWLVLRAVETQRLLSRLYLAIALALLYFPTELIAGLGLWLIWLALVIDPTRTARELAIATVLFAVVLAFAHPSIALMSLLYLVVGGTLTAFGRPIPRRSLVGAAAMCVLLLAAFFATNHWLKATNPTVVAALAVNRYNFIDPRWMLATMVVFPALAAQWLLLIAPGTQAARLRWRISPIAVVVIAAFGLWFAAAGTGILTWLYTRHTAPYILALAVAFALVSPGEWLAQARRPLMVYAAILCVAAISYNVDLFLFGRFVDRYTAPGLTNVDDPASGWPRPFRDPHGTHNYLKWAAGADYQRDVVVPIYDWYRVTLAFYSFYRSDRQTILFHPLGRRGEWLPFHCSSITRTLAGNHDPQDQKFLAFLGKHYCIPGVAEMGKAGA
jgi:hypothetical protein